MNGEYYEIAKILPKVTYFDKDGPHEKIFYEDEAVEYLKKNLNIDAKFNRGFFLDPRDNAGEPAVYKRNNKILTHQQVIAEIKKFLDGQQSLTKKDFNKKINHIYQICIWRCTKCGFDRNTGNFCINCGSPKKNSVTEWKCNHCNHFGNIGKFCSNCGKKRG